MRDGFVRLTSFPEPIAANLAKSKLESEGIEVYLTNENTIRMDYFYSQALGGVQLFVAEEDAERAQALLTEEHPLTVSDAPAEGGSAPANSGLLCPECGSDNVYNDRRPRTLTIFLFFFGLPFLLFRRRRRCAACSHEWSERAKR